MMLLQNILVVEILMYKYVKLRIAVTFGVSWFIMARTTL